MSLVNNTILDELTKTTNGKINNKVIDFAKTFLYSQLKNYISSEALLKLVGERLKDINIELLSGEEFKKIYSNSNGKGFIPGAFVYGDTIYFKNDSIFEKDDFHKLIHEILHFISECQENDKFYKSGLYIANKEKNYSYGYAMNEAFTEHLTSMLLDEPFSGYSKDLNYLIQLFMLLTNLKLEDLLSLYLSKKEWCTENIINKFNSSDNSLVGFIVTFDNRLLQSRKEKFNPDEMLKIILDAINQKVNDKDFLDTYNISEILKQYSNYFYSVDRELKNDTKQRIGETLDILGTYKYKMTR